MANLIRGATRIYADTPGVIPEAGVLIQEAAAPGAPGKIAGDSYMTALLKLIPTEVVSIYMAIRDSATEHHFLMGWFFLCLATCILLRSYSSAPATGGSGLRAVQWQSVIVSSVAFVLWAFSIGPDQPVPSLHLEQWLAAALAALFGVIAPLLVPAEPRRSAS